MPLTPTVASVSPETESDSLVSPLDVAPEQKGVAVQGMFNRIAGRYDSLNDAISFGMHRGWKQKACRALRLPQGGSALDVCTGTGDLIQNLLGQVGAQGEVTGIDFSQGMLDIACRRFQAEPRVTLVQGDALALPFQADRFDGAVVAFGLRNVSDISKAVAEMARVVKPGGWVVSLDTNPNPSLPGFKWYFQNVMPLLGKFFAQDRSAYEYLFKSTEGFLSPEELAQCFTQAGLMGTRIEKAGFGSVAIISGQCP